MSATPRFTYEASRPNQTIDACVHCGYKNCQCEPCEVCDHEGKIIGVTGIEVDCPSCNGLGVL